MAVASAFREIPLVPASGDFLTVGVRGIVSAVNLVCGYLTLEPDRSNPTASTSRSSA